MSWLRLYSCVVTDSCSQLEEPKLSQGPTHPWHRSSLEAKSWALEAVRLEAQCCGGSEWLGGQRTRLSLPFARWDVACIVFCSVSCGPSPSVCWCISLRVTFDSIWGPCQDVCGTWSEMLYVHCWSARVSTCWSGMCPFIRDISIPKYCKEFFLEWEKRCRRLLVRTNADEWDMLFLKPLFSGLSLSGPEMDLKRADTLKWDSRFLL